MRLFNQYSVFALLLMSTAAAVSHISWHLDHPAAILLDNDIGLVWEGDVLRTIWRYEGESGQWSGQIFVQ